MSEDTAEKDALTDAEVRNLPLDERVQIALTEELHDDGERAYEAILPLLGVIWDGGHFCDAMDEREGLTKCNRNPFARVTPPGESRA